MTDKWQIKKKRGEREARGVSALVERATHERHLTFNFLVTFFGSCVVDYVGGWVDAIINVQMLLSYCVYRSMIASISTVRMKYAAG